ncbi:MAG TPA: DUF1579 family protein [Gemmataceae bacterium]|nr:DUF1579 family protein [Gemmataceae bacterium]
MRRIIVIAVLTLVAASDLIAQPSIVKPGPEHEFLKQGVGVWDATVKANGGEIKGELHCKMAAGDLWMLEQFKMEIAGMPFEGYGATSYEPSKKKYVNVWIDSMVPSPMLSEGTYDKEKKTLTLNGTMTGPGGKSMKATVTITYQNANSKVLALKTTGADGKETPMVEISYKRRITEKK